MWGWGVAKHFESEGLIRLLRMRLPIELPAVGMITLRGSGLTKIRNGVTTIEEVLRETVA